MARRAASARGRYCGCVKPAIQRKAEIIRGLRAGLAGLAAMIVAISAHTAPANDPPPDWAYWTPQRLKEDALPERGISVPGSRLILTRAEFEKADHVPDWFPEDHPKMPVAVGQGRKPEQWQCSLCHMPNGVGVPDAAALAGLPAGYVVQQIDEFRAGRRQCAGPEKTTCHDEMTRIARLLGDADIQEAATYFSQLKYRSRTRVVEAAMAPKFEVFGYELAASKRGGTGPIGQRIIELADNPLLVYLSDPHTPITAYVPPGSIARGKQLVEGGNGAAPCKTCHGARLQGAGDIPPLAGRTPTYLYRQLYDIQYGFRRGPAVAPMQPIVARLNAAERIAIVAYLASLRE
jgi:cytochrome c553